MKISIEEFCESLKDVGYIIAKGNLAIPHPDLILSELSSKISKPLRNKWYREFYINQDLSNTLKEIKERHPEPQSIPYSLEKKNNEVHCRRICCFT